MSTSQVLAGAVDNGNPMEAKFSFFEGPVRVRVYGEQIRFAFFGKPIAPRGHQEGTLDGIKASVVEIRHTNAEGADEPRPRSSRTYAITVILKMIPDEGEVA
jgi:hypothetical protein